MIVLYLTIQFHECGGYELAIIISYPTSTSGITVLLEKPIKYGEFVPTLFVKTTDFQFVFILSRRVQLPYLESMV